MPDLDARGVLSMLDRHYLPDSRPPAGILAKEIESPNGRRRADAIWLPTTATRGTTGLVGHEVKVSRADVLVELADPTKCDPWMRYCHRWWLTVSDPALVDGLDIPHLWGVMAPPSGRRTRSMTILKPAPELHPHEPALGVQRVAAWYFHKAQQQISNAETNARHHTQEADRLRRDVQSLRAEGIRSSDPRAARIDAILKALDDAVRQADEVYFGVSDQDVAFAVLNYARVVRAVTAARHAVDGTLRSLTQVKDDDWTFKRARDALNAMQGEMADAEVSLKPEQLAGRGPAVGHGEAG
jgi:hypothetical protein